MALSFGKRNGFSFWFQFWPKRRGWGIFASFDQKTREGCGCPKLLAGKVSGKFRRCWKILPRLSGSTKCYPCQGLGIFRQGKRLLENWPRLRERCWIFSSETATAFLSSSDLKKKIKNTGCQKSSDCEHTEARGKRQEAGCPLVLVKRHGDCLD